MKSSLVLLLLAGLAYSHPQFSVFNRQLFPNFSFGGASPAAVQQQPAARPAFVSRPAPAFQNPRFFQRPQPARFVAQPSFTPTFNRGNAVLRESAPSVAAPVRNASAPVIAEETPAQAPAPSNNCNPGVTNVEHNGKWYFVQWKNRFATKYTWSEAKASCSQVGMKMISMDDPAKRDFFLNMLERDRYDYFWAGATIRRGSLIWENGASEPISRGRYPWSDRGQVGPQPEGNGDCLAILNNVYQDRVKYHDVACHHTKPTICECA